MSASQTEYFQAGSDGKYEHLQGGSQHQAAKMPAHFFATAACKSIHSILHAGLASNHSWFGGRILYLSKSIDCFPSTDFIFCQALIISPVSCIFTVNTAMDRVVTEYMARCCFHWQDCSNMSKVYTKFHTQASIVIIFWDIGMLVTVKHTVKTPHNLFSLN